MMHATIWYTGQQADTLAQAAEDKQVLYLTTDPEFAASYGKVYALRSREDAKVFDTANREQVAEVVEKLLHDYEDYLLPYELHRSVDRIIEWYGAERVAEVLTDLLSPREIRNESAYDLGDLQQWLWETFEFDVVTFRDGDTALLLNAVEMAVEVEVEEE